MTIAALYDIHGNLPALEGVLAEIAVAGADAIVLGGDIASGPMPRETLDRILGLGERARFIRGNADRELVRAFDERGTRDAAGSDDPWRRRARWNAEQINREQRDFLAELPEQLVLEIEGLDRKSVV